MQRFDVTSPDGVVLAAYAVGPQDAPAILFLHGICQSHLAWRGQFADAALAGGFRLVAIDLRGHGASDKPVENTRYTEDRRWADDVAAVIAAAKLRRPVLVGWSYSGRVIADYLRSHGTKHIAGVNFVGAVCKTDPATLGPKRVHLRDMLSPDLATCIAGTRGFLRGCFERQPAQDEFETLLAANMVVPQPIRVFLTERTDNPGDLLPKLDIPVLVTHGAKDAIILPNMGEWVASVVPGATLSLYPDVGHTPFMEDAPRFNRELAAFVRAAAA